MVDSHLLILCSVHRKVMEQLWGEFWSNCELLWKLHAGIKFQLCLKEEEVVLCPCRPCWIWACQSIPFWRGHSALRPTFPPFRVPELISSNDEESLTLGIAFDLWLWSKRKINLAREKGSNTVDSKSFARSHLGLNLNNRLCWQSIQTKTKISYWGYHIYSRNLA